MVRATHCLMGRIDSLPQGEAQEMIEMGPQLKTKHIFLTSQRFALQGDALVAIAFPYIRATNWAHSALKHARTVRTRHGEPLGV